MRVKKKILVTIGVLAALDLGLFGAGIWSIGAIKQTSRDIGAEQAKIDAAYALRRYARDSSTNLTNEKMRIGSLRGEAVQEEAELEFVTALESAASAAGIEQQIDLQTANQKILSPWEKEIPLILSLNGPYPQILAYLNAVERLPYYVTVSAVDVATAQTGGTDGDGEVRARVTAVVYWQGKNAPDFVRGADESATQGN